jgi:teichuronic acid biosynthesis glycosyltransferase TuaG
MNIHKVSIITPLFNAEKFIEDTIQSVLNQTYENWEMLIVDDGSTDNGLELAQKHAQRDSRIKVIQLGQNHGPAKTRNKAIEMATGRFIAFLDSDDLWEAEKLTTQIEFMLLHNHAFTYTAYYKMSEDGVVGNILNVPDKIDYNSLLNTCPIGCLTVIYDTDKLGKMYMPNIKKRQDYGLWLSILKKIPYAYGINEPLAKYRVRNDSISGNKLNAAKYQWKIYREVEKLSLLKSIQCFSTYFFFGVLKTYFK